MATSERRRPPLDHGHHLGNDNRRQRPHCRCHSLSLTNVRRGFFFVRFSRDGRHLTTTTPTRSQTRVGGGSLFVSPATAATSPPPPPLARKRELGVVPCLFLSRRPPPHHHHPHSLANASWGWFLVRFTCNSRHLTATTPPRSQTRVGGGSWSIFLVTAATRHDHLWVTTSTTNPLPRPKSEPEGSSLFVRHHQPLRRPKSEREGCFYVSTAPQTPSLAPRAREGGYLYLHVHDHPLPRLKHEWRGL